MVRLIDGIHIEQMWIGETQIAGYIEKIRASPETKVKHLYLKVSLSKAYKMLIIISSSCNFHKMKLNRNIPPSSKMGFRVRVMLTFITHRLIVGGEQSDVRMAAHSRPAQGKWMLERCSELVAAWLSSHLFLSVPSGSIDDGSLYRSSSTGTVQPTSVHIFVNSPLNKIDRLIR